jgi:hypothetical protein
MWDKFKLVLDFVAYMALGSVLVQTIKILLGY